MGIRKTVVAVHNSEHVSIMHQNINDDGTWSLSEIAGGDFDLAGAIELAADILKEAGGMLQMQASALRTQAARERRRAAKATRSPQ